MPFTSRMSWPFPKEDVDPWYEAFRAFVDAQDASAYAAREDRQILLAGGGTVSWTATGSQLSWTGDIEVMSPITGFLLTVAATTVTLTDGQVLYVTLVRGPTQGQALTTAISNQVPATDNALLLAARVGSRIYWRNGLMMQDGDSFTTIGASQGGAGTDPDAIHDNVSGEINAITEKVSPVGADLVVIEDSAATYAKKKVQITNLPGGTDPNAIHDNVSGEINAITEKVSPVGADLVVIEDSAAAYAKKKVQFTNLATTDPNAIHDNVAGEIAAITSKAIPTASDLLLIEDAADTNNKKRVTIGSLPGGGGGTDVRAANIVIGNSTNGDTSSVCDVLDVGDGTLLKSTIEGASVGDLIFVRAGTYDLGAGPQTRITIPVGVRVVCAGRDLTVIRAWTGADGRVIRITDGYLQDVTIEAPAPTVQTVAGDVVEVDTTYGSLRRVHVQFTGIWDSILPANVAIVAGFGFDGVDLEVEDCSAAGMARGNDWQPFGSAASAQMQGFQVAGCTGSMRRISTTQGYIAYWFENNLIRVHDVYAKGHWNLGMYITDCDRSDFSKGYLEAEFPPDFTLPVSYHDAIQVNSTDYAKVRAFSAYTLGGAGGPTPGMGIRATADQRCILVQNDFNTLYGASGGAPGAINLDATCDRNIVQQNIVRAAGVVDNGTLNDVAHNIL